MKTKNVMILSAALIAVLILLSAVINRPETKTLRIIATSDLHGKFYPWDYALNAESTSGSMAQLATAIAQYRTKDTVLVDAGDTIQDNSAEIFVDSGDVHPMIQAVNALNYDVWVTGNHEYNYRMETVKKEIAGFKCKVLTGNVYDENGDPIADGYTILERDGVRVAVIGMVTPNIKRWDAVNLEGCEVTDPLEETRKIIDSIQGQYDVLVGVFHMGIENEYGMPNSGVTDILSACPEFDVMVSSHEHRLIPSMEIGSALVVQNKYMAQTMSVIDLTLTRDGGGFRVTGREAESIEIKDYEADPAMLELLEIYDRQAREDAEQVIGYLKEGPLIPEADNDGIPTALLRDTALVDLINKVQMYYTGAKVSATVLTETGANLNPGEIRKCDMVRIYRFPNTLYKLHMTGSQLKKFMEWSVSCYNTVDPGNPVISLKEGNQLYNNYLFAGVSYEVDVSRGPGDRIANLTWTDGTPVREDDEFDVAVNNYCANSLLLEPGEIYSGDDLPVLLETDVHGEIGGIRELIREYIIHVKDGRIRPECDENWEITVGEIHD